MNNWNTVQFSDIADFKNGLNFKSGETGHALKVLGVGDFQNRTFLDQVDEISTIHTEKEIDSSYHLQDGDLVFVRSNGNKALVGRCMMVRDAKEKISFSGFTIRARLTTSDILPAFANLLMQAGVLRKELKRDGRGTNIFNLNQGMLSKIEIPLISIDQQREILDFFSNWNKAIEKTEALIEAKQKQFRWLVSKIYKHLEKSKLKTQPLSLYIDTTSNIHENTDAIIASVGKRGIRDRAEIYSKELSKDYSKNKLVYKNDIAFGLASDCIVYGINFTENVYSVSPAYKTFKIQGCNSTFLKYLLDHYNSKLSLKYLITSARQGKSVDFDGLLNERFVFPPVEKQKRIAHTLNTAQQEIKILKKLADQYRTQKRGLMQKILSGKCYIKNKEDA